MEDIDQMREFIILAETVSLDHDPEPEIDNIIMMETPRHPIIADLEDVVFRLRSLMENEGGDYGIGVEDGMQRAAEMIENLIKRHEG